MPTVLRPLLAGLLIAAVLAGGLRAQAQFSGGPGEDRVSLTLTWPDGSPAAGTTATLGVVLDITSGWHVQAGEGSGDEQPPYIATTVGLELPAGWTQGKARWPAAHTFSIGVGEYTETLRGYEGRIVVRVPVDCGVHREQVAPGAQAVNPAAVHQRRGYRPVVRAVVAGVGVGDCVAPQLVARLGVEGGDHVGVTAGEHRH